ALAHHGGCVSPTGPTQPPSPSSYVKFLCSEPPKCPASRRGWHPSLVRPLVCPAKNLPGAGVPRDGNPPFRRQLHRRHWAPAPSTTPCAVPQGETPSPESNV